MPIDHDRLLAIVSYNPKTGLFYKHEFDLSGISVDLTDPIGRSNVEGYLTASLDGKTYFLHRVAWFYIYGRWPKLTDHVNCCPSDNRIENLREADPSQSSYNTRGWKKRTSIYKGVHINSGGKRKKKWRACMRIEGRTVNLGSFETEEEAHQAYVIAAKEHAGEFANAAIRNEEAPSTAAPR